jgi:peptidoglycan/LPS O-acetylase OafA/YrhL
VSLLPYIAETTACLVVILLFATTIHVAIERPTMKLSEKIARRASLPPIDPVQAASAREAASWNPEQAGQGSNSGMAMHTSSM